jgi:hypothetical protein
LQAFENKTCCEITITSGNKANTLALCMT